MVDLPACLPVWRSLAPCPPRLSTYIHGHGLGSLPQSIIQFKVTTEYSPFSSVLEFVCLPWSEVCSARVTSLLLLLLLLITPACDESCRNDFFVFYVCRATLFTVSWTTSSTKVEHTPTRCLGAPSRMTLAACP